MSLTTYTTREGLLYEQSIKLLLLRRSQDSNIDDLLGEGDIDDLFNIIAELAYQLQSEFGSGDIAPEIPISVVDTLLATLAHKTPGMDFIGVSRYLTDNSGVFMSPGQDQISGRNIHRFAHPKFQEYLSAVHLINLVSNNHNPSIEKSYKLLRDKLEQNPDKWRLPALLVDDVLVNRNQRFEIWKVISDLLDEVPKNPQEKDSRWLSVWLSSHYCVENQLYLSKNSSDMISKFIKDILLKWLLLTTKHKINLSVQERIECGRCLGLLGDIRSGVNSKDNIPDIEWVEIPAGSFKYQEKKKTSVRKFYISKYPITNQQFQLFLDDPNGFYASDCWNGLSKREAKPGEVKINIPNYPRTQVSWYDCAAFCNWLSDKIGFKVSMPSEIQWEKAARGPEGFLYPNGDKPLEIIDTLNSVMAVGIFNELMSPYGVCDMSGNIREWCLNKHSNPQDTDPDSAEPRSIRGSNINTATLIDRYNDNPNARRFSLGFRILTSSAKVKQK